MIYSIDKKLHRTFGVFEKKKLAPRAYMIPYADREQLENTSLSEERYHSSMVKVLSGNWDFKYYKSEKTLPDKLNTSRIKFGTLPVPGDWQRNGISEPIYLNIPYEFHAELPDMPEDMPVGVYRKKINITKVSENSIVSFLGVATNLALYVNSEFAGYSEGTHNTAEFNIGSLLHEGENELLVVSFKWCNGCYLESQDMFRENGIFRDVLLYEYPDTFIYDCELTYKEVSGLYDANVKVQVNGNTAGKTVTAELKDRNGKVTAAKTVPAQNETDISFGELEVRQWSAELPEVYYLYVTLTGSDTAETVRLVTGFRTFHINGQKFELNGKPLKCLGVNHHDACLKGYAMTVQEMENDIKLMKELNINAVRTSHYPPDPLFITFADIYGIYIIDEADIEVHGCDLLVGDTSDVSYNKEWAPYFVDRVKRMYYRDRNHPSVTMWSLCNESGGSLCQDKAYEFLKSVHTPIPVHCESVRWKKRFHYDVISEMYTSTEAIEKMMQGKRHRDWDIGTEKRPCHEYEKYPYFLCEYCHAQGVGPGNLEEYVDLFYRWDSSMGGCIWEWCDHTVYHEEYDKKYKYHYTYGGDHSKKEISDHGCCNGIVFADRRLHTGAKEVKAAYRPVTAKFVKDGTFEFENRNRFRSTSYMSVQWIYLENGEEKAKGVFDPVIEPMQKGDITIALPECDKNKDCHINFIYTDKNTDAVIATEQVTIHEQKANYELAAGKEVKCTSEDGITEILFDNGKCVFDESNGNMTSYVFAGKEVLCDKENKNTGFIPSVYRAMTDNDRPNVDRWQNAKLNRLTRKLIAFSTEYRADCVSVKTAYRLKNGRNVLFDTELDYLISGSGEIKVHISLIPGKDNTDMFDIPCFGITVNLDESFENVEYFGRGEDENMPDFKCHAPVGIYKTSVKDSFEPYVFPQGSGAHCDTRWVKLSDKNAEHSLTFIADGAFAFTAHPFTDDMIDRGRHIEDISEMGLTALALNGEMRGIGSSSCGPDTRAEYRLDARKGFEMSFTVVPEKM